VTILASDNFTRAANADLGANWDPCTGADYQPFNMGASNNAITSNTALDAMETNNAATWPNDGYVQATFWATETLAAGAGYGVVWRAATGATETHYRVVGNGSGYELGKYVAGTYTAIVNSTATTFASGDILRMEWVGTAWTLKKNGTTFDSGTDASIASGRAGVVYSSTNDTAVGLKAWEAGDLGGVGLMGQILH